MSFGSKFNGVLSSNYNGAYGSSCRLVANLSGEYITLGTIPLINDLTMELYIRTSLTSKQTLISGYTNDITEFISVDCVPVGGGVSTIKFDANTDMTGQGSIQVNDGEWHKVVATLNITTGNVKVYVDDVFDYESTYTNIPKVAVTRTVQIGILKESTNSANKDPFIGQVANASFKYGSTLASQYPIDDGLDNNPTIRETVNSRNATIVGATSITWVRDCDVPEPASTRYTIEYSTEYD